MFMIRSLFYDSHANYRGAFPEPDVDIFGKWNKRQGWSIQDYENNGQYLYVATDFGLPILIPQIN
jgi:hypothetical protein